MQPAKKRSEITVSMSPIKKEAFGYEQARHLIWRAGFGATPRQIQTLVAWGPEKSVDRLLGFEQDAFDPVHADTFDRNILRPPTPEEQRMAAAARRSQDEESLARIRMMRQEQE